MRAVAILFEVSSTSKPVQNLGLQPSNTPESFRFSEPELTPKQFLLNKSAQTDVERVACLAFYLSHYRDMQHFRTRDISTLNTEAAQRRFSNAAVAVDNATKSGYLVPSVKGAKQLSAIGEQFVMALPDREAAKAIMSEAKPRRAATRGKRSKTSKSD